MTSGEVKSGLPTWAKLAIGLVLAAIIGLVILFFAAAMFFQKVAKDSQDPQAMARIAGEVAKFEMPLPPDYHFASALGFAGFNTVSVEHKPDHQMLILITYPSGNEEDAQTITGKLYDGGMNIPQMQAKFSELKNKGTATVGGESMPYMVGTLEDSRGSNKFEGMVAAIASKKANKTVVIYGVQPPGAPYNLDGTMDFLKTIKGF